MFALLVDTVMWALVGGAAFGTGMLWEKYKARTRAPKHEHLFDQWEDTTIQLKDTNNRVVQTVSGQKRLCLGCGYKDVRKVRSL